MSGKNLKIDGKVCPNVTVIKALDTDQNKLVEFVDTSDANATSSDIITGKTAYVDGKKVIGEATAGIDTSDATAIAADIRVGKTAYAKDVKLTGTIEDYAGSTPIQLTNQNGEKLNTKGKYCPEDITVVPQLQEKTVTPSETQQTATPDANYAGLSKVIVGAIPDDYVIPSGTIQITENGVVDVSGKANANVNVPSKEEQTKSVTITSNGSQTIKPDSGKLLSEVTVIINVSGTQPQLHAPTISKSDTIITITDSALNGDFVTGYKLYANNVLLSDQTENTADLSALITEYGNYSITAKCKGTNFQDSEASNAIEYVYEQIPSIYEVDGETLRVTNSNYVTDGGILKLL